MATPPEYVRRLHGVRQRHARVSERVGPRSAASSCGWIDPGKRLDTATKPAEIQNPYSVSPDGKTLAMRIAPGLATIGEVWLQDLTRGVLSRFTFRGAFAPQPDLVSRWDAHRLFQARMWAGIRTTSFRSSRPAAKRRSRCFIAAASMVATDWSTDGRFIAYTAQAAQTSFDLWLLPLTGERKPVVYLQTPFNEVDGQFLPDAGDGQRWMAYQSNESGRDQIYIQAIPASGAKYQISTEGGTVPRWRRDGRELFYISADQRLVAVPISAGSGLQVGKPQPLFANAGMNSFVPSRSGDRFLINVPASGEQAVHSAHHRRYGLDRDDCSIARRSRLERYFARAERDSTRGGSHARCRGDGRQIFYRSPDGTLASATPSFGLRPDRVPRIG